MPHKVHVFALSTCGHCRNAKAYLEGEGIDFSCIDVDKTQGEERKAIIEEVKKFNPELSFPTIIIDDDIVVVGFKRNELEEALK